MRIITNLVIQENDGWRRTLAESNGRLLFLGDYFNVNIDVSTNAREVANFKRIIDVKKENPDQVTLLIGNRLQLSISRTTNPFS
ncbi:hypothetical protein [Pedobacter sp.]|uniref:hypothetical protein n=1 Tax=Pedobacter sp. TaxID=1411316 RepID=UPI003D7F3AC2